jgi:hypothetical protein
MTFFDFEADFVTNLRCIPMQVRLKLDTCGVKLKLDHWHRFSQAERQNLVDWPCEHPEEVAAYRDRVQALVKQQTGQPAQTLAIAPQPPWLDTTQIPEQVTAQAEALGQHITLEAWQQLQPAQRFALIKLSRPGHENRNFLPALREFHLVRAT